MVAALTKVETGIERTGFEITPEQVELIRKTVGNGLNDLELSLFLNTARSRQLDPLTRQIYAIKSRDRLNIFASIDGLRVIAQRSGEYAGQEGPLWCGADGEWTDVWLQPTPPAAAKVGVWRTGFKAPTWGVATFKSFGQGKNTPTWNGMPDVMLAKCAESIALRKAFPDDLSGLYVREEFGDDAQPVQQGNVADRHGNIPKMREMETISATVVEDDGINADPETGEIIDADVTPVETLESVRQEIKDVSGVLGFDAEKVRGLAKSMKANYGTLDGAKQLRSALLGMLPDEPDGEAGDDAWTS